jgi:RpiB/LacA/LacB family sugar-phosphate isomerase
VKIAVATDHAGFPLKDEVIEVVVSQGHEVIDLGTDSIAPVDYPDYAEKLGRAIQDGQADRGILLCGSGVGAAVAANKLKGIRAGLCHDTYSAHQSVEHDNVNVLALGAGVGQRAGPSVPGRRVQRGRASRPPSGQDRRDGANRLNESDGAFGKP